MAKIALLLFVMAILVSLHANEAHHRKGDPAREKDLTAKKKSIQGLTSEVKSLSKSEQVVNNIEKDHNKNKMLSKKDHKKKLDSMAYAQKLKKFRRVTKIKRVPARKRKSVSIIQSILKDFGLNGGRN
ncbi:uncharacterized protein LOC108860762 [Raphanus sativus]|uniref:Uncharacterized protein LOC108860762 n=1 Tax=Raphanus sativus TaxID=3726 RepID=A0A6J0P0T0_RAPSA|nr:uncharacterized protein LOC108860762 [Raphanus sativus]